MQAVANNTFLLTTTDKRQLVYLEKSSGLIRVVLVDEVGIPVSASQLSSLRMWLYLRDNAGLPVGGINSVSDTNILNDGVRGTIGSAKAITGAIVNHVDDDFHGVIRVTIGGHGYSDGDLVAVRGVRGVKGANGDWTVQSVDTNTVELLGSSGSGTWAGGGTATKALHVQLQPNDNAIVQSPAPAVGSAEWHEAFIVAEFNGRRGEYRLQYQVINVGTVT